MRFLSKGVITAILIALGSTVGRVASVEVTTEMAIQQMQNVAFIPSLTNAYSYTSYLVWAVVLLLMYGVWRKEIKAFQRKIKQEKEKERGN